MTKFLAALGVGVCLCVAPGLFLAQAAELPPQPKRGDVPPDVLGRNRSGEDVTVSQYKGKVVIVTFWASWCGPCRMFAPVYEKASTEHPDIVFAKVDTEAEQSLAAAAQISSIPTLMAFKAGTLVFSQPGALPAAALEQVITAVRDHDVDAAPAEQKQSA